MSTSVSLRALAPARLVTVPGDRRRASASPTPVRRGEAQTVRASRKRRKQKQGGDVERSVGDTEVPSSANAEASSAVQESSSAATSQPISSSSTASTQSTVPTQPLPVATRDDVMDSCYGTTFWLLAIGVVIREGAHFGQGKLPDVIRDYTADLPLIAALHPPSSPLLIAQHTAIAIAAAVVVTFGRKALLSQSAEFREATNRSNKQVLTPLDGTGDLLTVSVLPAVAEETVFRGVLLPALLPFGGPAAVLSSGLVFGALHVGGGRNASFAVWASVVGMLYGAAAMYTGDIATAMLAHALANYTSATLWLEEDKQGEVGA